MKTYKNIYSNNVMRLLLVVVLSSILFNSCYDSDKIGDPRTQVIRTMGEYLEDSANVYSEFNKLLDTTRVMGLLKAAGSYTCFAPTNKAMKEFYAQKGRKGLSDFQLDTLKQMAYDHIISGVGLLYSDFVNGRLPYLSMSDRYIHITFSDEKGKFAYINKTSGILVANIGVYNGVIFKIDKVLDPTRDGIIDAIAKDSTFSIFYTALEKTGLVDSLLKIKDPKYDSKQYASLVTNPLTNGNWIYQQIPVSRKYGYTVLMESNTTMNKNGITDLESLKKYAASVYDQVYPEDAQVTSIHDRRNSLNRFVAYHLINKQLSYSKFIDDLVMYNNTFENTHMINSAGLNMYEYIETMCPNTLMEICRKGATQETNLINRDPDTDKSVKIVKSNSDKDALNGVYHEVSDMLVYSKDVDDMLSSKRLRFDAASFFPELTNNNMRGNGLTKPNLGYILPKGYLDRLTCSDQTVVNYLTPYEKYLNFQGDEVFLSASSGKLFDFSFITPPIPAGTYEVRFGYLTNGKRGVTQLYFDHVPAGVPLNLNTGASDPSIGYELPHTVTADYEGYENDKMMRNQGYMKAPACFKVPVEGWQTMTGVKNARYCSNALRRILGTYTFKKAGSHIISAKALSGGEFMMDYIEFVPTSALESEDIY